MSIPAEYVRSAIRSRDEQGQTFVFTSARRWLLVQRYGAAYDAYAAAVRAETQDASVGPDLSLCVIVRPSTSDEFYQHCAS